MNLTSFCVLASCLFALADDTKGDLAAVQGGWRVTMALVDGKPDASLSGTQFSVSGDRFERKISSATVHGRFVIDAARKPKSIETTYIDGPAKGRTSHGIYVLRDDTWQICFDLTQPPTPKTGLNKPEEGLLLLVLHRVPPATPAPPVSPFADKNLDNAVRAALHHTKPGLSEGDLNNLYFLEAPGAHIRSLAGLEKCPNLALLKLTNNDVSDIGPLKNLGNLQSLDLAHNRVSDLRPLSELTKLQYIELSHNHISKLDGLRDLTNLFALYLSDNSITDLAPIAKLTRLSSLELGHNQLRDISVLAHINRLSTLELKDNLIENLEPLRHQTELSILMLERNRIKDLAPLVHAAKADAEGPKRFAPYLRLYLQGNPLSEQAKAKQLMELKSFGVRIEG
jgi:internalin A